MTDAKILGHKLNLEDSLLNEKGKEEFLMKTDDFHNIFSLRDEIINKPFSCTELKCNEYQTDKDGVTDLSRSKQDTGI